jgi:hypothetical protein
VNGSLKEATNVGIGKCCAVKVVEKEAQATEGLYQESGIRILLAA